MMAHSNEALPPEDSDAAGVAGKIFSSPSRPAASDGMLASKPDEESRRFSGLYRDALVSIEAP